MKIHLSHRRTSIYPTLLLGLWLPFTTARAQANEQSSSGGFVGLGVMSAPNFQGSDQYRTTGQAMGEYHWSNGLFLGGSNGLVGIEVSPTPQLRWGIALGMDRGRKESDSSYLAGMGEIEAKGTLNAHAQYAINAQLALSGDLQLGIGNAGQGGLLKLGSSYTANLGTATQLSFKVEATVANADYMQAYFGVSASQVMANGYSGYTPAAGLRDVSASLNLNHQITRNWLLIGGLASTRLSSAAQDSPLVRKATSQNVFAAVAYRF